jgi:hypothetical protein
MSLRRRRQPPPPPSSGFRARAWSNLTQQTDDAIGPFEELLSSLRTYDQQFRAFARTTDEKKRTWLWEEVLGEIDSMISQIQSIRDHLPAAETHTTTPKQQDAIFELAFAHGEWKDAMTKWRARRP